MDERLVALGWARPAPAAAPPVPLAPVRPVGLAGLAGLGVSAAPLAPAAPLLRRPVRVREGRREVPATLEIGSGGVRLTVEGVSRTIGWTGISATFVARGSAVVVTPQHRWELSLVIDDVVEPALSPYLVAVIDEGRRGRIDPVGGALHELANASDRLVDAFGDADDPFVPLAVGSLTLVAGAVLAFILPVATQIAVRRDVAPATFAIDPRLGIVDPRGIVAAAALGAAIASWSARYALRDAATVWARGTLRGWHRSAAPVERAIRSLIARALLAPGSIALAGLLALGLLIPSAAARTTIDASGIHQRTGLPVGGVDRSWAEVVEVLPIAVGSGERPLRFATAIVLADGTRIATRGSDLSGGTERELFDRARSWMGSAGPK